jgi:hypothetical protein
MSTPELERPKSIEQLEYEANRLRDKFIDAWVNHRDSEAEMLWEEYKEAERKFQGVEQGKTYGEDI